MNRPGSEHSNSYWPGYVDALVNVVLNLMFLAAILAIGSFTQGLENSRRAVNALTTGDRANSLASEQATPASPAPSGTQKRYPASQPEKMQLNMHFADFTVRLDDNARERLKRELLQQMSLGVQYWQVSIDLDVNDNMQRRAAYLRMISVRSVFVDLGIDPNRVSLRMQAAEVASVGEQVVRIVPRWQAPERKSPASPHEGDGDDTAPQPEVKEPRG